MVTDREDNNPSPVGWRQGLLRRVDALGRYIEGRFVIDPDPDVEAIPAQHFFEPDYFMQMIARSAGFESTASILEPKRDSSGDLIRFHAHVSRFVRHYTGSISIPALVGLAEGIGLDASVSHCTIVMWNNAAFRSTLNLAESDIVRCRERPTSLTETGRTVESVAELQLYVWQKLYGEHISPFIRAVVQITKISEALLWTNAAEAIANVSEAAIAYLDEEASRPFLEDRQAILSADKIPGVPGDVNPLQHRQDWTPVSSDSYPYEVSTRRLCCLTYLLEDRFGRLCGNCPHLPLDEKIALARELDSAPAGVSGGAAQRRAIARGLQRPSAQRMMRAKDEAGAAEQQQTQTGD